LSRFARTDEGISRFAGLVSWMGANLYTLEWRKNIPADANLIVIAGPTSDFSDDQTARLWAYLMNGGRILLLTDAINTDGTNNRTFQSTRGLFQLTWSDLGIRNRSDIVSLPHDVRTVDVTETDRDGNITAEYSVESPLLDWMLTTDNFNGSHPILDGFVAEDTHFHFEDVRSIEVDASLQTFDVQPLIYTTGSDYFGESDIQRYLDFGVSEYDVLDDTPFGELILAASMEDNTTSARMILIGDSDFVRNGYGFQTSPSYSGAFIYPDNVQFMMNAVAWLLEREPATYQFPLPAPTATATLTPTPTPIPTATPEGTESS
ncbi:MAG: Gldg family protein, partial [Anaerolineae bacterium]|nr:Gldg family protein [Anaerolineae bacterium]